MHIAYIVVTVVAALAVGWAALVDFQRAGWILDNMRKYGVPQSWLFGLGAAKAVGAAGILIGLALPPLALVAAAGLVLFFIGALTTVTRARMYPHLAFPLPFLALSAATLALRLAV